MQEAEARLAQARATLADLRRGKRPEEIDMIEANLAEAGATLTYAQRDLERQTRLERRDFAAEARLDQARSDAEEARARVAAIEYDPNNRSAHYLLAQLLQQTGRVEEAKREFAIAERLKPAGPR